MAMKFKPSVYMIILFVLTSLATIAGLYLVVDSMILGEDVKNSLAMLSKAITPAQYYAAVAILSLLIIMKWFGSFIMFRGKPWGFILYVIPNLILLAMMTYLIIYNFRTENIYAFGGGTLAFIIAYLVAMIMIIKKRKALRKNIAG
ncbi:MAG: hypothetical protein AB7V36_00240 [Bacteroidales bacterium]|nr:hypothetical protein [Bacteroidales bacterium]